MKKNRWRPALKAAFPHTLPILTGFLFLGMAYGILMRMRGFHPLFPTVMALTIFGGSLEYVCVEMLCSAFAPAETLLLALLIQARHLFYGIAMLDKYRDAPADLRHVRRELLHQLYRGAAQGC